jgi:hypothetical protein
MTTTKIMFMLVVDDDACNAVPEVQHNVDADIKALLVCTVRVKRERASAVHGMEGWSIVPFFERAHLTHDMHYFISCFSLGSDPSTLH